MARAQRLGLPPPSEYRDLVQEIVYGGSRVEIGGGRLRGDGSIVAWSAQFVKEYGVVARGKYGVFDLTKYSELTCRKFGATGVPTELETEAKKSPVQEFAFVKSAVEAEKAIRNGNPISVGSSWGGGSRGPWNRDSQGFLKKNGSWSHCMAVLGVVNVDGRKGFLFMNSWGSDVHNGPKGGKNIPDSGCFFVDWNSANSAFAEGDAVAFSSAKGFPVTPVPTDWAFLGSRPK